MADNFERSRVVELAVLGVLKDRQSALEVNDIVEAVPGATNSEIRDAIWALIGRGQAEIVGSWKVSVTKFVGR